MADDPQDLILKYIEADLASETQRKSSLETKAAAILTANLGIVTLFFAVRTQLGLATISTKTLGGWLVYGALLAILVSITFAVLTAIPKRYGAASIEKLTALVDYAQRTPGYDYEAALQNIIKSRLVDLTDADRANSRKARASFGAIAALGAATLLLVLSFFM
jgi:hypothetical protein